MNTLYITRSGRILLDENNTPKSFDRSRSSIDDVFFIKEDTKVVFERGEYKAELDAKAGDIVVTFYEEHFPNRVIVVNNEQWKENLETYEAWEQIQKEEWAAKKVNGDPCCDCECCKGC
jgi:hypothetical protein